MSDNNTGPIAWVSSGYLLTFDGDDHYVLRSRSGTVSGLLSTLPSGAVPLVRQDEAQKIAEWLIAEVGCDYEAELQRVYAERDHWKAECNQLKEQVDRNIEAAHHWKAECEKAQTERDVLFAENLTLIGERLTMQTERDELREKLAGPAADQLVAKLTDERNEALSALADWEEPDADNPTHLRFAADVIEKADGETGWNGDELAKHVRHALRIKAQMTDERLESEQTQVSRRHEAVETLARKLCADVGGVWEELGLIHREGYRDRAHALVDAYPGIVDVVLGGE